MVDMEHTCRICRDGRLPVHNPTFIDALYFGELDINGLTQNVTAPQLALLKLRKFLSYTYFSGVRYILVGIVIHIALFVEREWVVRDEGYLKLLHRKIGKEPKTQLVDMLQNALDVLRRQENQNEREDAVQEANLNRAIDSLQDRAEQMNIQYEEELRRAINRGEIFNGDVQRNGNDNDNDNLHRPENYDDVEVNHADVEVIHEDDDNLVFDNVEIGQNAPAQDAHRVIINDESESDDEDEVHQPLDDDFEQMEQQEEGNNNGGAIGEIMEVFGIILNIKTPLFLMVVCDSIITAYLFLIYVVPYILGDLFVFVSGYVFKLIMSYAPTLSWNISLKTGYEFADFSILTIREYIVEPCVNTFNDLVYPNNAQYSLVDRILVLGFGYAIICVTIHNVMKSLTSGPKPIVGSSRRIYKVLFELSSTAKVFVIFAIEIFFFPVYCGWLLDFCAAPLFLDKFTQVTKSGTTFILFLTSIDSWTQVPYIRTSLYWASGTLYMLFFALFVGMVRNTILRPGVLYFIRSPDDPNARLIHDALVKPLGLQLSRIYLSAKVYTGFILFGIGGVTWGLRYMVAPSHGKYNVMLPMELSLTPSGLIFMVPLGLSSAFIRQMLPLITKYVRMYWARAFELSAHKLRLSHFIMGKPISQERGHIVYRSWKDQFLATATPDYSQPVTYRQAQEIFATNSEINACFVPDGYYVRAPDNDTVSRKFIKKLFVPVTKDDKLLRDINEDDMKHSGYETPSSEEEELNTDDAHCIVYRPPNFKLRCFGLILMLWVFAVLLILLVVLLALVVGRPIAVAQSILFDKTMPFFSPGKINWKLADSVSLIYGLLLEVNILKLFDRYIEQQRQQGGGNEVEAREAPRPRLFENMFNFGFGADGNDVNGQNRFVIFKLPIMAFVVALWLYWIVSVHLFCVDFPFQTWFNTSIIKFEPLPTFAHFVASWWTLLPGIMYLTKPLLREQTLGQSLSSLGFGYLLLNYALVYIPALSYTAWKIMHLDASALKNDNVQRPGYFPVAWICSFVMFAVYRSVNNTIKLYDYIGQKIKAEKYVKGRAIVNDDEEGDVEGERL
ncbi:hypothetical protein CANMA_004168 [Candida margitis]|uniref:uncharacterized protein n=1 Tax=Candida margitis TaxID=1775924 RepID=UPI002227EB19|nr:uncharacterized protein CANMA_004168 [Candida margitis]KAI5958751.1 hypothetical protein CANMA_004168 [Candida margitis]